MRQAKTQISLCIRPVWSESLLCVQWVANDPNFLHADSEDSDQTGRMPRLIWVFAGRTCHLVGFVMRRLKYLYEHSIAVIKLSLCIRPVWSESLLCVQWVANDPNFLHADSEDSDQTGRMPRLIWVFAGRTCHLVGFVMRRLKYLYEHSIAVIKLKVERYGLL